MSFDNDSFFSGLVVGRSMKGWGTIVKGLPISKTKANVRYTVHQRKMAEPVSAAWTITPESGLVTPVVAAASLEVDGRKTIDAGTVTGTLSPNSGLVSASVSNVSVVVEGHTQVSAGMTGTLAPESGLINIEITSFRFAKDE